MKLRTIQYGFVLTAAALVLAAESDSTPPDDLIRRANAAFLAGELELADSLYAQAAERTNDPGLVTYNRASVLFHKKEYSAAERLFHRVLDDREITVTRKANALYNRGVCLVYRGDSAATFRTAIACFEQSLALAENPDARHNLELAKVLWASARSSERTPPRPNELPPDAPPESPRTSGNDPGSTTEPGGNDNGPGTKPKVETTAVAPPPGSNPKQIEQKAAGAGNLPVLLDPDRPENLTPEQVRAALKEIGERLTKDRKSNARLVAGPERPHVRDW